MRLNDLPLVENFDNLGIVSSAEVFFFLVENRFYTWRGKGQRCPKRSTMIAGGKIAYKFSPDDGNVPLAVIINSECSDLSDNWSQRDIFETHILKDTMIMSQTQPRFSRQI